MLFSVPKGSVIQDYSHEVNLFVNLKQTLFLNISRTLLFLWCLITEQTRPQGLLILRFFVIWIELSLLIYTSGECCAGFSMVFNASKADHVSKCRLNSLNFSGFCQIYYITAIVFDHLKIKKRWLASSSPPPPPQSCFLSVVDTHIISGYIRLKKARYGTVSNLLALKNLKIKKQLEWALLSKRSLQVHWRDLKWYNLLA